MRTEATAVVVALLLAEGCDGDPLSNVGPDAGLLARDAGFPDAGFLDAGLADAGVTDAGFVDGGPEPDAGFPCDFPDEPPQPTPCEGDVDYCDAVESRFSPEADLLATWSHIDGDDLVVQLRVLAPPFRHIPRLQIYVLFDFDPAQTLQGLSVSDGVSGEVLWGDFVYSFEQDRTQPTQWAYPPPVFAIGSASLIAADSCEFRIGLTSGLLEVRRPLGSDGEVPRYAVMIVGADDSNPASNDVSWSALPTFILSEGGRADDESDLVSVCSISCNQ